jgi:hypothetical protein
VHARPIVSFALHPGARRGKDGRRAHDGARCSDAGSRRAVATIMNAIHAMLAMTAIRSPAPKPIQPELAKPATTPDIVAIDGKRNLARIACMIWHANIAVNASIAATECTYPEPSLAHCLDQSGIPRMRVFPRTKRPEAIGAQTGQSVEGPRGTPIPARA